MKGRDPKPIRSAVIEERDKWAERAEVAEAGLAQAADLLRELMALEMFLHDDVDPRVAAVEERARLFLAAYPVSKKEET